MRILTDPDHCIIMSEPISCYEICESDFAYNLICVSQKNMLVLILISLPEESGEFVWNRLQNIILQEDDTRCHAIAFSPDTSLNSSPNRVTICASIGINKLMLFHTNLRETSVNYLNGHTNYINDISWVCDGELVASVSDDFTCKFWSITKETCENVITFCLSSAGMSIKGHPEDPNKVLVAEKRGVVHLYNVRTKQTVVSVESPKFPLMSADWCRHNRLYVTAVAGGDIVTWDLSRPFVPTDIKQVHEDGGRIVRFAPGSTELAMASIGRPDQTLKVFLAKSTVPLILSSLKTYGGLAWHQRLPYISAASDRKILFWKVQVK